MAKIAGHDRTRGSAGGGDERLIGGIGKIEIIEGDRRHMQSFYTQQRKKGSDRLRIDDELRPRQDPFVFIDDCIGIHRDEASGFDQCKDAGRSASGIQEAGYDDIGIKHRVHVCGDAGGGRR